LGSQYEALHFHGNDFAGELNETIDHLASLTPPKRYHGHEDRLAEYVRTKMNGRIQKIGTR
jgi:hypothetical protein